MKLRALRVRKMVLLVHDLEMRGRKIHLIHNYEALKGGAGGEGKRCGEKKKKSLQVGNLKTHKPQHPPRLEKEISNTAFNNSEDIKRTLVFVGKSEEAGLFIDMKWIFGGCCYGLSDVCLYSIFPLR